MNISVNGKHRSYSVQDIKAIKDLLDRKNLGHRDTIETSDVIMETAWDLLNDFISILSNPIAIYEDGLGKTNILTFNESEQLDTKRVITQYNKIGEEKCGNTITIV